MASSSDDLPKTQGQQIVSRSVDSDAIRNLDWERLGRLMEVMVRAFVRSQSVPHNQTLDIVNSVVSDLLRKPPLGFSQLEPARQEAYLTVCVRNKVLQKFRKHRGPTSSGQYGHVPIGPAASGAAFGFDPAASAMAPLSVVAERESLQDLQEDLERLAPETLAMLRLHADGVPWNDIAEVFKITSAAARKQYSRVLRDLAILAMHREGQTWKQISAATNLDTTAVERRHRVLSKASL